MSPAWQLLRSLGFSHKDLVATFDRSSIVVLSGLHQWLAAQLGVLLYNGPPRPAAAVQPVIPLWLVLRKQLTFTTASWPAS